MKVVLIIMAVLWVWIVVEMITLKEKRNEYKNYSNAKPHQ